MPNESLRVMVQSLYNQAKIKTGETFKVDLPRGLRVHVRVNNNQVDLLLSRSAIYPSDAELKTVLKHWPWTVMDPVIERTEYKDRFYIKGSFPCCQ